MWHKNMKRKKESQSYDKVFKLKRRPSSSTTNGWDVNKKNMSKKYKKKLISTTKEICFSTEKFSSSDWGDVFDSINIHQAKHTIWGKSIKDGKGWILGTRVQLIRWATWIVSNGTKF